MYSIKSNNFTGHEHPFSGSFFGRVHIGYRARYGPEISLIIHERHCDRRPVRGPGQVLVVK